MIGIPRSTFYNYFFPFWSVFFTEIGLPFMVSPPTDQLILKRGLSLIVDEFCLPIKIHLGHLAYIQNHLTAEEGRIFSPGFGRWGAKGFFCPKLMALPDLAKAVFPRTVEFWHDLDEGGKLKPEGWRNAVAQVAPWATKEEFQIAWEKAWKSQQAYYARWEQGQWPPEALAETIGGRILTETAMKTAQTGPYPSEMVKDREVETVYSEPPSPETAKDREMETVHGEPPSPEMTKDREMVQDWSSPPNLRRGGEEPLKIALIGHPYLVYDETANQNLVKALHGEGVRIYTVEMTPAADQEALWPEQGKKVFWPVGQQMLAAALYYSTKKKVDGIIFLTACLCGPDALIGELLEKYLAKREEAPSFLQLIIDEHTGRAGLLTRIEAFIDLLRWRRRDVTV